MLVGNQGAEIQQVNVREINQGRTDEDGMMSSKKGGDEESATRRNLSNKDKKYF